MNNSSFIELKAIFTNYSKFMTKEMSKAIMLRTKLRNQFLKKTHQKLN